MVDTWIEIFGKISTAKEEINLLNVYKGVPLSFPARVVSIEPDSIQVFTDNHQSVCMFLEKHTYIQSQMLPEILEADVLNLDTDQNIATLGNFRPIEQDIGQRRLVRIQPKESLEGNIQLPNDNEIGSGTLADISQNGLAVYLERQSVEYWRLKPLQDVVVILQIPGTYTVGQIRLEFGSDNKPIDRFARDNIRYSPVPSWEAKKKEPEESETTYQHLSNPKMRIHAVIANMRLEASKDRYRIGMKIVSTEPPRQIINQFITQRQSEIIREIRSLYNMIAKKSAS